MDGCYSVRIVSTCTPGKLEESHRSWCSEYHGWLFDIFELTWLLIIGNFMLYKNEGDMRNTDSLLASMQL
jgi:hypothetical protein